MDQAVTDFVRECVNSGLVDQSVVTAILDALPSTAQSVESLQKELIRSGRLTSFQTRLISRGKGKSLRLGNYVILDKLGAGGMGVVFLAEHERMKRRVAVKVLPATAVRNASSVERFQREVRAAARLVHPQIVAAFDADETNGVHFLVMEYVEGQDLSSLVRKSGPLSVSNAVDYITQAAQGLVFAHEKGVIHRDVKPSNLLLSHAGIVKILDMGLASLLDSQGVADHDLTGTGVILGTLDYMSPEQGLNSKLADARSDIYSLGCTLYFLLTGMPAYPGETPIEKVLAHRDRPIPSLCQLRPDVPAPLDDIFRKMMAKEPGDRQTSMSEVLADLQTLFAPSQFEHAVASASSADTAFLKFLEQKANSTSSASSTRKGDSRDSGCPPQGSENVGAGFLAVTEAFTLGAQSTRKAAPSSQSQTRTRNLWYVGSAGLTALLIALILVLISRGGSAGKPIPTVSDEPQHLEISKPLQSIPDLADHSLTTEYNPRGRESSLTGTPQQQLAENTPFTASEPSEGDPEPAKPEPVAQPTPPAPKAPQPVEASSGPRTIRVGGEEGMTLKLEDAFAQARGGDTIEIATDQPIHLDGELYWNQPGTLEVRAADGKRPIIVANPQLARNAISFGRRPAVLASQDDSVKLTGLTLVDLGTADLNVVFSDRSITLVDVLCITTNNRFLYVTENAAEATLERCYNWRRPANVPVPQTLCTFSAKKISLSQCLFTGSSSISFLNNRNIVRCEQSTFLGTNGAWQISDQPMSLTSERNLYVGLNWVMAYYGITTVSDAARIAEAKARLPQYRGNTNGYFQCQRLAAAISPNADADLVAWQAFTKNGENNPQFIDPQFARSDLISLVQSKVLPPRAFALKPTSPHRRLKIGCDVQQLPELPPKIDLVLPADILFIDQF